MHDGTWWFLGMHTFWWLFWILLVIGVASLLNSSRKQTRSENALDLLQRRYAAGEISSEDYEERKAVILRDVRPAA